MSEWRTMDSAPDGDLSAEIDIWDGRERKMNCRWVVPYFYPSDGRCWCYLSSDGRHGNVWHVIETATHWMPSPKPPAS